MMWLFAVHLEILHFLFTIAIMYSKIRAKGMRDMGNEFEVVSYEQLRHFSIFLNRITYRNYHFHGAFELMLVLEGQGRISIGGEKILLEPGSLVLINPYEAHEINGTDGSVLTLIFQVSPHFLRDYVPELPNIRFLQHLVNPSLTADWQERFQQMLVENALTYLRQEPYFALSCVALSAELLECLLIHLPKEILSGRHRSSLKQQIDRMRRITDYMEAHYLEPIHLDTLAQMEGLTSTYVSHLISNNLGISFQEYLNNLRFEKAMDYLRTSTMTLTEIAVASGFSDLKYLNKVARKRTGQNIQNYKNQISLMSVDQKSQLSHPLEYRLSPLESIDYLMNLSENH